MKKPVSLILTLVLCLLLAGNAWAAQPKDLVEWGSNPVSNDPPRPAGAPIAPYLDYMDPDNPNDPADVGSMECTANGKDLLECVINNGYPGYQASVEAEIINISGAPVAISSVTVIDRPECILAQLTDLDGHDLTGKILDKNSRLQVKIVNRIKSTAEQQATYKFKIELVCYQTTTEKDGGTKEPSYGPSTGSYTDYTPDTPIDIPPSKGTPPVLDKEEPMPQPEDTPRGELPYTGREVLSFLGTGLCVGCIGGIARRIY